MKKALLCLLMVVAIHMSARDIYVYNGTSEVKTVKDVRKITFGSGVMNVEQENGVVVPVSLAEFNNFSFFARQATSVHSVLANGVEFSYDGKTIKVSDARRISVYSLMGTELACQDVSGKYVQFSMKDYPAGIYIVKVTAKGRVFTQKITKR